MNSKEKEDLEKDPKKKESAFSIFYSWFCTFDVFGTAPTLNYSGSETYQTGPGAILSIAMNVAVILCIYFRAKMLFKSTIYDLST